MTRKRRRAALLCILSALLGASASGQLGAPLAAKPSGALLSLASLFDPSTGVTRDTNGDGLSDSVAARIIVASEPCVEDVQAAATIAARLGFETTALSLPVVLTDSSLTKPEDVALPILVGRGNAFIRKLAERGDIDLNALGPGQGLVSLVRSPMGGPDGVAVVGADDKGTLNAAMELGARLPRLWAMAGIDIAGIETQAAGYLRRIGFAGLKPAVVSVVVDADRRGVAVATLVLPIGQNQAARILRAFEDLDLAHRRGQEARTLNFANVAATRVELLAAGKSAGRVDVRRSGFNTRTLTPPLDPEEEEEFAKRMQAAQAEAEAAAAKVTADKKTGETAEKPAGAEASRAKQPESAQSSATPPPRPQAAGGAPARGESAPEAGSSPAPAAKAFDLSNAYSIDGWFGDSYMDLIPDRTETSIIVGRNGRDALGAADIAARLGLESTGITFPLAKPDEKVREAAREGNSILVGRDNRLIGELDKIGKTRLSDLQPGEGMVHVVPRAFGQMTATVVAGADQAGSDAASAYLARRVPYLWDTARGAASLDDLVNEATDFLQARGGAGQASMMLGELRSVLDDLKDKTVESVEAKLFLSHLDPGLDAFVESRIEAALKHAKVKVSSQRTTDPVPSFEEKIDIPWEVDEFWTRFRTEVLPKTGAGAKVEIELRVSEPPDLRRDLASQIRAELVEAGAASPRVRVLSAYKQGFHWLTEEVIPPLRGRGVRSVRMKVAEHKPDLGRRYRFYQVPTRWVHELYPIDEIMQRELGLPLNAFSIELADAPEDIYEFEAFDGSGRSVHRASFSPRIVEREYLDKFPGWSRVEVTTGWLTASVDGKKVSDGRIQTDPERFWDYYQSKVLSRIHDSVMKLTGGRPTPDKQPFHRDLDVEIWMSEPDYRLGLDEEQVSSLEALHEDIYFVTLDFYTALGRTAVRQRLASPGKILPIIHPARPGKPGQARILYAANASARPKLELTYMEKDAKPVKVTREVARIDATAPIPLRAIVRKDSVREITLQVEARDDREAGRAIDALDALVELRRAGVYKTTFSWEKVESIAFDIVLKDGGARRIVTATDTRHQSNVHRRPARPAHPLVTWDHIIGPDESEKLVAALAAYPEVAAYRAGRSFRERDISVMEITLPAGGELVSLAKATTFKPTIFLAGRQHANEVSSTSHTLRLAELLVTDPAYHEILEKVNVIVQPVENPDGAEIAFELQKLTPTHMLHAGRYSAVGSDVGSGTAGGVPLPESLVRGRVWRDWLPDIYLNLHGYPSHEWVQPFAGYVPPGFRPYLLSRGWYTQLSALRDPRYPAFAEFAEAIRDAIVREINADPDVRAMNLRHQSRYRRWAFGFQPHVYPEEIYKDTMFYFTNPETGVATGSRRAPVPAAPRPGSRPSMNAWPHVTYLNSGVSESPDETAQGDWLPLVIKPGLSFVMANIKYLRDGRYEVQRIEEDSGSDGAARTVLRVRPVLPPRVTTRPTT
ncbi:MAG: M14 family zinc carboxypeptidase [Vicinamibacterales bacterium]